MKKRLLASLLSAVMVGAVSATAQVAKTYLVIGGGSATGIYYQVALNICKLVNEKLEREGYNCLGRPALGSVSNINAIRRGLLDFGVAQSIATLKPITARPNGPDGRTRSSGASSAFMRRW